MADKQRFFFEFQAGEIDREAGIIRDVSVITQGLAKGHGMVVDDVMCAQVKQRMEEKRGGLKVKLDHGYSAMQIVGKLRKPRIDGKQVKADLHLLNTSKYRDYVVELADEMPGDVGLSISFRGQDEELPDGRRAARCGELFSADLVDRPAANAEGLFSDKETEPGLAVVTPDDREETGMPDGSFPVATSAQAESAIKLRGRSKSYSKKQVLAHVSARVGALLKAGKINSQTADELQKKISEASAADSGEQASAETPVQLAETVDSTKNANTQPPSKEFMDEKQFQDFKASQDAALKAITDSVSALAAKVAEVSKPEAFEAAVSNAVIAHMAKASVVPSAPAPAAPVAPPAPVAKTFEALVDEAKSAGKSRGQAIAECAKTHPSEYREYREKTLGFITTNKPNNKL